MTTHTQAEVVYKTIKDLMMGDKLLTPILGYKGRTLLPAGIVIDINHLNWLKKQQDAGEPKLANEMYVIGEKAKGEIKNKRGNVLAVSGETVTEEIAAKLVKEGFEKQAIPGNQTMLSRGQKWDKNVEWNIDKINPKVKVETSVLVTEK